MFHYSSISTYHEDLKKGATSCQQAVTFYLDQIRQYRDLNAFVSVYGEEALRRAEALDRQRQENRPLGKLHGVVIALKDVLCYQDHPVQACSKILKGFTSIYHASAVERLLKEEAIIIGHTNCDEFAMGSTNEHSAFGPVKNGIDTTKVPGGSSGGSAVAVQMDCCMVSLGSDTGGSVRQPADFCGVLGLKPTYGRISRYGLIAYASSFDQIGLFAKKVEDLAVVLEVISGPDELDSTAAVHPVVEYSRHLTTPLKPSRIAYFKQAIENENLDPEIRAGMESLIQRLNQKGYKVEPIDFEYINYVVPTYYVLTTAEASSNLSRYDGVKFGYRSSKKYLNLKDFYCQNRSEGFGWEVKKRIMLGTFVLSSGYYDAYFTRAQQVRQLLMEKTKSIFKEFEYILLPNSPTPAFPIGSHVKDPISLYLADIFTVFSNLTGLPAISLPLFWHSNGLPFGVQVMANHFREKELLRLSEEWVDQFKVKKG